MITPTIGRVIWFVDPIVQASEENPQPWPAFICYVHDDRTVNVAGFMANGEIFRATKVQLLQDDDVAQDGYYYAMWMPYQVSAAAKNAAPVPSDPVPALLTPPPAPPADPVPSSTLFVPTTDPAAVGTPV
jgi:hypothetical protein